jgi:hypothetical protein
MANIANSASTTNNSTPRRAQDRPVFIIIITTTFFSSALAPLTPLARTLKERDWGLGIGDWREGGLNRESLKLRRPESGKWIVPPFCVFARSRVRDPVVGSRHAEA